ncbi:hypothetical protein PH5382_00464 [Phaeobacter sp. CECT 5382]|nr:hypothetical protein PH5382_00464 [Phaeobacter sp. CECT 5382]
MVFPRFGKCTGDQRIPPISSLIPPRGIGITLKSGISWISTISPEVIPTETFLNRRLISLIIKAVNQSVTNVAAAGLESCSHWG